MSALILVVAVALVLSALAVAVAYWLSKLSKLETRAEQNLEAAAFVQQIEEVIRRVDEKIRSITMSALPDAEKRKAALETMSSVTAEFDSLIVRYRQLVAEGELAPNEDIIANLSCTRRVLQEAHDKLVSWSSE